MTDYDDDFLTRMTEAIENDEIDFVRQQLDADPKLVDYNEGVGGWLDSAIDCGHLAMAKMLIEFGCDVNELCDLGTPLGTAISADRPDMVRFLLENGAEIRSDQRHVLGPLGSRARNSLQIVKILEQYGADFDEVFVNEQNGDNINALFMATMFGHQDVEDYLKSKGCKLPEQPNQSGGRDWFSSIRKFFVRR